MLFLLPYSKKRHIIREVQYKVPIAYPVKFGAKDVLPFNLAHAHQETKCALLCVISQVVQYLVELNPLLFSNLYIHAP